ncbi:hypothetical protein UPYG_G00116720 [Umbra pygmaea]|uniref:DUF4211 domain-containing protein n=1 Tax=Umbra pygmaea TaxID=75934 RepID=A0ABD0XLF1_UMBPY
MESLYKRKVFATMRKNKAEASKKRAEIGLPSSILDDSDEESCASTTSISASDSESDYRNSDSGSESTPASGEQSPDSDGSSSSEGRSRPRRKRVLVDSSSDSDSDVGSKPKRKVIPQKRIKQQSQDSDSEEESSVQKAKKVAEAKDTAAKRKQRQSKLLALSKEIKSRVPKRRGTLENSDDKEKGKDAEDGTGDGGDDNNDNSEDDTPDVLVGSSDEEAADDSDSLKDFIVEDETGDKDEEVSDDKAFSLPRQFIAGSQLDHFRVVLKALMINVLDETFLKSLYGGDRTKRYAQEMKASLFHFDERTILPRLENLKQRSRWTDRYKERVECYPNVRLVKVGIHGSVCEACALQRQCSVSVRLSGQLYDLNSMQEDQFMPDDTQAFSVGSVCASRTEVYHALKHFKYHLFQHCRTVMEEEKNGEEEPVKETVKRVFTKLEQSGWISEQYEKFQDHLNDADYFQEEKLD